MAPDRGFRGNGTRQRFPITSGSGPKGMLTLAVAFAVAKVSVCVGAGGLMCALHSDMRPGVVLCVCVRV